MRGRSMVQMYCPTVTENKGRAKREQPGRSRGSGGLVVLITYDRLPPGSWQQRIEQGEETYHAEVRVSR